MAAILRNEIRQIKNIKKAYIQLYKGDFANEAAYVAFMGCEFLKIPTQKFDYDDIGTLDIDKNTIIHFSVCCKRRFFMVKNIYK